MKFKLNQTKEEIMYMVKHDFEVAKKGDYTQHQKNVKYSSLMKFMEDSFNIPLLDGEEFENMDSDVKELYLALSNARNFDIYENGEETYAQLEWF